MKAFKKLWRLIFLSATLTVALCACGGDKAGDASSHITIGIPQDLSDSLDPHEALAAGTREILFNIYEGLVKPDSNGDLKPAVADEYSVSEDGLTYTFHLRKGVKFHNGKDVTADDVLYSIGRNADPSSETVRSFHAESSARTHTPFSKLIPQARFSIASPSRMRWQREVERIPAGSNSFFCKNSAKFAV